MAEILYWLAILAVVTGLGVAAAFVARAYMSGTSPSAMLFKPRPEPRLNVVELARVDSRRQLVLIRRDDVEHLIMTGGPVDVVIETGIAEGSRAAAPEAAPPAAAPVFTRPTRGLGQPSPPGDSDVMPSLS